MLARQLRKYRKQIIRGVGIPRDSTQPYGPQNIQIFFGLPKGRSQLWWACEKYAGGHFNKDGTRMHISLPFIKAQGIQAGKRVAEHEFAHIQNAKQQNDGHAEYPADLNASLAAAVDFDRSGQIARRRFDESPEEVYVKENLEWFIKVFKSYQESKILSRRGGKLLNDAKRVIAEGIDLDENLCTEVCPVIRYFRRIPNMTREEIFSGFPQVYFRQIDKLPRVYGKVAIRVVKGCPNQCTFCPVQQGCKIKSMPYPLLVMLGRKQNVLNYGLDTFFYDPLYYEDVSGALYYDVAKLKRLPLYKERDLILTHGAVEGFEELASRNIARINSSGKKFDIIISVLVSDRDYFIKKARGDDVERIAAYYTDRYLKLMRQLAGHSLTLRFMTVPENLKGCIEQYEEIMEKVKEQLSVRLLNEDGLVLREDRRETLKPKEGEVSYSCGSFKIASKRGFFKVKEGPLKSKLEARRSAFAHAIFEDIFTDPDDKVWEISEKGKLVFVYPPAFEFVNRIPPALFNEEVRKRIMLTFQPIKAGVDFIYRSAYFRSIIAFFASRRDKDLYDRMKPYCNNWDFEVSGELAEEILEKIIKWDIPIPLKCVLPEDSTEADRVLYKLIEHGLVPEYKSVDLLDLLKPEEKEAEAPEESAEPETKTPGPQQDPALKPEGSAEQLGTPSNSVSHPLKISNPVYKAIDSYKPDYLGNVGDVDSVVREFVNRAVSLLRCSEVNRLVLAFDNSLGRENHFNFSRLKRSIKKLKKKSKYKVLLEKLEILDASAEDLYSRLDSKGWLSDEKTLIFLHGNSAFRKTLEPLEKKVTLTTYIDQANFNPRALYHLLTIVLVSLAYYHGKKSTLSRFRPMRKKFNIASIEPIGENCLFVDLLDDAKPFAEKEAMKGFAELLRALKSA
jgi:hypothetical protein